MANQKLPNLEQQLMMYQAGAVGQSFLKKGDIDSAKGALEVLIEGLKLDDATREVLEGFSTSDEIAQRALEIYSKKYDKTRSSMTVGELSNYYNPILSGYLDKENGSAIITELKKHSKETFGNIMKKIGNAQYILIGKDKYSFKDSEIKNAEAIVAKYGILIKSIELLEKIKLSPLFSKINSNMAKKELNSLAGKLKGQETQKKK